MKSMRTGLFGLLAFAGAACSHGPAGPVDACSLISAQRAGAILGAQVTTKHVGPQPTQSSDASECMYMDGTAQGGFLLIAARTGFRDARAEAQLQMQTAREEQPPPGVPGLTVSPASGPGQATWLGTSSMVTELHVLDHGMVLVLTFNQPDSPAVRARASALAKAALDHARR